MRTRLPALVPALAVFAMAGCATAPQAAPARKAAPAKPVVTAPAPTAAKPVPKPVVAPEVTAPTPVIQAPLVAPKLSPEAAALVERLTAATAPGTLQHEVIDTTSFPGALQSLEPGAAAPRIESNDLSPQPPPRGLTADGNSTQLVERDWTGLVLVPISTSLSKAYTSDVRLAKVEAHPLNDGRVRIWTRVHNMGGHPLPAEIACEFRMKGTQVNSPYFYQLDVPPHGYRDVFFVSPDGTLNSYTVLVRSTEALQH